jgi:hypothetical protein
MKRKKEKLNKNFNPEKYKMACCPYCKGTGKSPDGDEGVNPFDSPSLVPGFIPDGKHDDQNAGNQVEGSGLILSGAFRAVERIKVCSQCGGFGWIKKEGGDQ